MSLLRQLFGPSQEETWTQLCQEIGADFVKGNSLWQGNKVQAHVGEWTITLDNYQADKVSYTRFRAPYINRDGLRFTIYHRNLFSNLGKALGMQDIEVGYPDFDDTFIIKGTDAAEVKALLDDAELRALLSKASFHCLSVQDDEGWFGAHFPEGVDELYLLAPPTADLPSLKALFTVFGIVLNRLCHIGSAYHDDPKLAL